MQPEEYCDQELSLLSPLYDILGSIPLLDIRCGPYDETVSYDPKHLVKRCWCAAINETICINNIVVTREDLKNLLLISESNISLHIDNILKPGDKRSVPGAAGFVLICIGALQTERVVLPCGLEGIGADLLLLSHIFEALLGPCDILPFTNSP